jgi:hypothetical protein
MENQEQTQSRGVNPKSGRGTWNFSLGKHVLSIPELLISESIVTVSDLGW